jgi:cation diffusion facilitator CzcD-associated flavoprotein CzcO
MTAHVRVAIVGAGFGGLGTAIRLRRAGIDDFVVFDRAGDVGGTWRDNTYPGCACDVPSHLYSFSFAPNPDWTRQYSRHAEIWAYLRDCVDRYGVRPHLRLGHEVTAATWSDADRRWQVETDRGAWTADILVVAAGPFDEPALPDLPGLSMFTGTVFHSARWDHDYDLTGRRVAVVGTGASAIQFVPEIAGKVGQLFLFQRTPPWILPHLDRPIPERRRRLFRSVPALQRLARTAIYWTMESFGTSFLRPPMMRLGQSVARRHLRSSVPDPALRAKLTPDYTMGCKRVLQSNRYYPALQRDNVEVVTDKITEIVPTGVGTSDRAVREVDAIVFGTGFHVTDIRIARSVRGRDGLLLADTWQGSPRAYKGMTVAGFPNLFLLLGPNTGLGHNSVVFMIECQITYLLDALRHMDRHRIAAVEPRPEAQRDFVSTVDRRMSGTVWTLGGCRSWYQDSTGRNSTIWPGYTWAYKLRTRRFDPAAYRTVAR